MKTLTFLRSLVLAYLGVWITVTPAFAEPPGPTLPGRLIFTVGNGLGAGLAMANPNASNVVFLTPNPIQSQQTDRYYDASPTVSAGGSIAFLSTREGGQQHIWLMNADGGELRRLTTAADLPDPTHNTIEGPAISPDGARVAFISDRSNDNSYHGWLLDVARHEFRKLTNLRDDAGNATNTISRYAALAWDPAGQRIAYLAMDRGPAYARMVRVVNATTGEDRVLKQLGSETYDNLLDWSPDGTRLVVGRANGFVDGRYVVALDLLNAATGEVVATRPDVRLRLTGRGRDVRFSPDGQWLAFWHHRASSVGATLLRADFSEFVETPLELEGDLAAFAEPLFWSPSPNLPEPARLELSASLVELPGEAATNLEVRLVAENGDVVSRSVRGWQWSGLAGGTSRVRSDGLVTAGTFDQEQTLLAINGGVTNSVTVRTFVRPWVWVEAVAPDAYEDGPIPGRFVIRRKFLEHQSVNIRYASFGGTAQPGRDYRSNLRTQPQIVLLPGQTGLPFSVLPVPDTVTEPLESVSFNLGINYASNDSYFPPRLAAATVNLHDGSERPGFYVADIQPSVIGNDGQVTLRLFGNGFTTNLTVRLTHAPTADQLPVVVRILPNGLAEAQFQFADLPTGTWSVIVTDGANSVTLGEALTVAPVDRGELFYQLLGPDFIRGNTPTRPQEFAVVLGSTGNVDSAPLDLRLATDVTARLRGAPQFAGRPARVLNGVRPPEAREPGDGRVDAQFFLPSFLPGESLTLPFEVTGLGQLGDAYMLSVSGSTLPWEWASLDRVHRPSLTPAASGAWKHKAAPVQDSGTLTISVTQGVSQALDVVGTVTEANAGQIQDFVTAGQSQAGGTTTFNVTGVVPDIGGASLPPKVADVVVAGSGAAMDGLNSISQGVRTAGQAITEFNGAANDIQDSVDAVQDSANNAIRQGEVIDYLASHGLISDVQTYNNLNDAQVYTEAGSQALEHVPGADIAGAYWSALDGVVDGAVELKIWNEYRTDPELGFRYGFGLTRSELIDRIKKDMDLDKGRNPRRDRVDKSGRRARSKDPNDIAGPDGFGAARYIAGRGALGYRVDFENMPTVELAAQVVEITNPLDPETFDSATFQLGVIRFADHVLTPPPGSQQFMTEVDLRPAVPLLVVIEAGFDRASGVARWSFTSVDPQSGVLTTNPDLGFLPPNTNAPAGQGSVSYTIRPPGGLASETRLTSRAQILFDDNEPIDTPEWFNTVDATAPEGQATGLPASVSTTPFPVGWTGTDAGSGIADYMVYVSTNGGPFGVWQRDATRFEALFAGEPGGTYAFAVRARDFCHNVESGPLTAEAVTTVATGAERSLLIDLETHPLAVPTSGVANLMVHVTNPFNTPANATRATLSFEPGVQPSTGKSSQGTVNISPSQARAEFGTLGSLQTAAFAVTATVGQPGEQTITAQVSADGLGTAAVQTALRGTTQALRPELRLLSSEGGTTPQLEIRGEPGRRYALEFSSDLVTWRRFDEFLSDAPVNLRDLPAPTAVERFYQAVAAE